MSKKITHEQARQHLEDKIKDGNILTVLEYIKQQEKQEKLLELYIKIYNGCTDYHDYDELKEIQKQIKELENE